MGAEAAHCLGVQGATHDYSGVVVLHDVDFDLRAGEVHALVGENGSGKSTLIKLITGAMSPRHGHIVINDKPVGFSSPEDAQRHGIAVVHQDYNLFPALTVTENVLGVGKHVPRRRWGGIHRAKMARRVAEIVASLGVDIRPDALVGSLGPAERKFTEIARAMVTRPRFLILDEPTASLEPKTASHVLALVERLSDQDVGVVFVSHRLDEVVRTASRITVLRDGRRVAQLPNTDVSEDDLVSLIIGRAAEKAETSRRSQPSDVLLRARNLKIALGRPPVEFELKRGEILGLTGLLGSGAAQVVKMVGGAEPLYQGEIWLEEQKIALRSPRHATRLGIGFIPEDRKGVGLVPDQSVAVNVCLASLDDVSRMGVVRPSHIAERGEEFKRRLDIRASSVRAPIRSLSGGNQQKVMIAKWLASGVRLLAIEEPTHGVDVGAKPQIHNLLRDFADNGGSILLASTDLREVLHLCDRIAVFRHGAISKVLSTDDLTHSELAVSGVRDPEQVLEALVDATAASGPGRGRTTS
jgi:ABC-type sugar transport system ATPase subunit